MAPSDIKDIKEVGKLIENLKRDLRTEMRELKDSIKYCSDTCDDVKGLSKEIAALREEVREMTTLNRKLKTENERLSQRIDELEQYQRMNNLEIRGITEQTDPIKVVERIGQCVGATISPTDIDTCHWVQTPKAGTKNIIVRFVQRSKRDEVFTLARKKRLNAATLGYQTTNNVFVNEHLTQANKKLLAAAKQRKREVTWKYVWTSKGKVCARRDDNTPVLRITSLDDLSKMTPVEQTGTV